jgi:hypothetical protein
MLCYYLYDMGKKEILKSLVGKEASVNYSPTLRAKLVKVNKLNCTWEVVASPYSNRGLEKIGNKFHLNLFLSDMAFFGV